MSIDRLEIVISPPDNPAEVPTNEVWREVEHDLAKLPNDYKDFINRYGTGCIDSFIWVFNPASSNNNLNLGVQVRLYAETLKNLNESGMEPRIVVFPTPHGVLPFGVTDNGDVLFWETNREPDSWAVAVLESRSWLPLLKFEMNMTSFLAGVSEGSIVCDAFPEDFPSPDPGFVAIL